MIGSDKLNNATTNGLLEQNSIDRIDQYIKIENMFEFVKT